MTNIEAIRKRLDAGLYRSIRVTRYFVRCDAEAEAQGLPYYGVWSALTEDFVNTTRYARAWEAEQEMTRMNETEGPFVVDVEADIRTILSHVGSATIRRA